MPLTRRQQILLLAPFLFLVVPFLLCPAVFGFAASFTNYAPFQASLEFVRNQLPIAKHQFLPPMRDKCSASIENLCYNWLRV